MKNSPIRRSANQSIEELADQIASAPPSLLTPNTPEKKAALSSYLADSTALFAKRETCDLSNPEAVRSVIISYLHACSKAGRIATFAGLCSALGYSRKHIYDFLAKGDRNRWNDDGRKESIRLLSLFQTLCADQLLQGGLTRTLDTATVIFALKNSGQSYADKSELEIAQVAPYDPLNDLNEDPERWKRYLDAIPELLEDDDDDKS